MNAAATHPVAAEELPGHALSAERMPGHWLLARLGKRVLRPGGIELTNQLLDALAVNGSDDVVELAPGLGVTTERILACGPASYRAVERDPDAAAGLRHLLSGPDQSVAQGTAADTGLDSASADVVFGEAYLTMQPDSQKAKIVDELSRITRPGGRLGLHEIALAPEAINDAEALAIRQSLTQSIKVSVRPLTVKGWEELLGDAGFDVEQRAFAPLHLLEPRRLIADEGLAGAARFASRLVRQPDARSRVLAMRSAMRAHAVNLQAVMLTATRRDH